MYGLSLKRRNLTFCVCRPQVLSHCPGQLLQHISYYSHGTMTGNVN